MAIIKCPECGRQISDKAPTCPNCGVEIAGKVVKCPDCFNVYFKDEETCPNCHRHNDAYQPPQTEAPTPQQQRVQIPVPTPAQMASTSSSRQTETPIGRSRTGRTTPPPIDGSPRKSHAPLIISFVIALIICAICFYFYQQANNSKEREEYEFAMQSNDPLVLQTYLDNFTQAPGEHRDSIAAHLEAIKQGNRDWANAVVSGSRAAIEDYLRVHPNSTHRIEALHKIDSLDWTVAQNQNSLEAFKEYIDRHADGEHFSEAKQIYDRLVATVVTQEDIDMVKGLFKKYFQSINSKDESSLLTTVTSILKNFLGKENANSGDVVNFLHQIYRDDMSRMIFSLNNDFSINKKTSDTGGPYEFSVSFSAGQNVERDGKQEKNRYRIRATVSPEGKISGFNMTRIVEQPAETAPSGGESKPAATSSSTAKPAASASKPAATASKPAATTHKQAATTSKPAATTSKPSSSTSGSAAAKKTETPKKTETKKN
ncbi:MAG: zinc-ribbon domain-containing protein [Prevotella sp.]|nr:zinc-ribbon domain-containing protein [Prevotella sp.]